MSFNELIVEDPELAADKIIDGLRYVVNTCIPEMYVSREEWAELFPYVCQKIKDAEAPEGGPDSLSIKASTPVTTKNTTKKSDSEAVG